ncbi:MAG: septum formation family protein [Acidimicrobiales bacterium]|nr:septum formation family protein [Acidimicrobiales bacterium]
MRRARLLTGAALAAVLALTGCGDDGGDEASADPAEFAAEELEAARRRSVDATTTTTDPDELAPSDVPGAPINQFNLQLGDCFDRVDGLIDGRPNTITAELSCDEPHHFEVFHRFTYPAEHPSPYPGEPALRDYALQVCYRRFAEWVGNEYEVSELDIDVIVPRRQDFEDDAARYRGMHCSVTRVDGEPMIGTSEGSGW